MKRKNVIWHDRKRTKILGLPWTFTVYNLTEDRLYIDTGLFNSREDEVRLYRITDLTLTRNFWQKIIGTGTIHVDSGDKTMGHFDIKNIKRPLQVKDNLSEIVESARVKARVYMRESLQGNHGGPGADDGPEHGPLGGGMDFDGYDMDSDAGLGHED
ncbi:MAG: PH domain-containing protein [Lachnospiraceae bacterium]|nr:PH domain-containing protein [Lachnospiraceae bacterium]